MRLFSAATRFVIIYAADFDGEADRHVRPRKFTGRIKETIKGWDLSERIPNKYPYDKNDPDNTSVADFFIYSKRA